MHELSIALSLLDVAAEEAEQRGVKVRALHLRVGDLAGVVEEALRSAFEIARAKSPLSDAALVIERVPVRLMCPQCRQACAAVAIHDLRCCICGSAASELVSGRELELWAIEAEDSLDGDS